ncbi:MAG: hypothetical protein JOS17DRAFT_288490 [Linnemannia elongata]|nr:MAG: hypothetical protein JOS17DRAFT_288490 [Linnemannia elongata]
MNIFLNCLHSHPYSHSHFSPFVQLGPFSFVLSRLLSFFFFFFFFLLSSLLLLSSFFFFSSSFSSLLFSFSLPSSSFLLLLLLLFLQLSFFPPSLPLSRIFSLLLPFLPFHFLLHSIPFFFLVVFSLCPSSPFPTLSLIPLFRRQQSHSSPPSTTTSSTTTSPSPLALSSFPCLNLNHKPLNPQSSTHKPPALHLYSPSFFPPLRNHCRRRQRRRHSSISPSPDIICFCRLQRTSTPSPF